MNKTFFMVHMAGVWRESNAPDEISQGRDI